MAVSLLTSNRGDMVANSTHHLLKASMAVLHPATATAAPHLTKEAHLSMANNTHRRASTAATTSSNNMVAPLNKVNTVNRVNSTRHRLNWASMVLRHKDSSSTVSISKASTARLRLNRATASRVDMGNKASMVSKDTINGISGMCEAALIWVGCKCVSIGLMLQSWRLLAG
jgi:hypothetical protein